jgi:hypothetical protein
MRWSEAKGEDIIVLFTVVLDFFHITEWCRRVNGENGSLLQSRCLRSSRCPNPKIERNRRPLIPNLPLDSWLRRLPIRYVSP